ncbi:hypothetical protein KC727_00130 [Candidatus Kaiserbacteria bacterium]|nr:hypothetical protein [Candidatus Kaiserbacteria bacterium]
MKKKIFISIAIVLLLVAVALWGYLFFVKPPAGNGDLSGLPIGGSSGASSEQDANRAGGNEQSTTTILPKPLRQLTTRAVAGATFTESGVRFMERGTGHIFDINLLTGAETQVTNTTLAGVVTADFSPSTNRVLFGVPQDDTASFSVGTITRGDDGGGTVTGFGLPTGAHEVAFTPSGEAVFYVLDGANGAVGYQYTIASEASEQLFSVPIRDIRVLWGNAIYVYPAPTAAQPGSVYRARGDTLEYVTGSAYGLTATAFTGGLVVSYTDSASQWGVGTYIKIGTSTQPLGIPLLADKCAQQALGDSVLYCAATPSPERGTYPDDWYKGLVSFDDALWELAPSAGSALLLSNFKEESGRQIDATKLVTDRAGERISFINKIDTTLWIFDTTLVVQPTTDTGNAASSTESATN